MYPTHAKCGASTYVELFVQHVAAELNFVDLYVVELYPYQIL
jgi:hypothetical protein